MDKGCNSDPSDMEVVEEVVIDASGSVAQNVPIFEAHELDLSTAVAVNSYTEDKESKAVKPPRMRTQRLRNNKPTSKTVPVGNKKKKQEGEQENEQSNEKFNRFSRKDAGFSAFHAEIEERIKAAKLEAYLLNPKGDFREYPGYFFALNHCLKRASNDLKCVSKDNLTQVVTLIEICEKVSFESIPKTTNSSRVYVALKRWTSDNFPIKRTDLNELHQVKETLSTLIKEMRGEAYRRNLQGVTQLHTAIFLLFAQPLLRINYVCSLQELLRQLYRPVSDVDQMEKSDSNLLHGLDVHTNICIFCYHCTGKVLRFEWFRNLNQHIGQTHSVWHLKCPRCETYMKNINSGNAHFKKYHASIQCEDCKVCFEGLSKYEQHSCPIPEHESKPTRNPIILERTKLDEGDDEGLGDLIPVVFESGKVQIIPISQPKPNELTDRGQQGPESQPSSTSQALCASSSTDENPSYCLGRVGETGPCLLLKKKEKVAVESGLDSGNVPTFTRVQLEFELTKLRECYEKQIDQLTTNLTELQEENKRLLAASEQTRRDNTALTTEVQMLRALLADQTERNEKRRAEEDITLSENLNKMRKVDLQTSQP